MVRAFCRGNREQIVQAINVHSERHLPKLQRIYDNYDQLEAYIQVTEALEKPLKILEVICDPLL